MGGDGGGRKPPFPNHKKQEPQSALYPTLNLNKKKNKRRHKKGTNSTKNNWDVQYEIDNHGWINDPHDQDDALYNHEFKKYQRQPEPTEPEVATRQERSPSTSRDELDQYPAHGHLPVLPVIQNTVQGLLPHPNATEEQTLSTPETSNQVDWFDNPGK